MAIYYNLTKEDYMKIMLLIFKGIIVPSRQYYSKGNTKHEWLRTSNRRSIGAQCTVSSICLVIPLKLKWMGGVTEAGT